MSSGRHDQTIEDVLTALDAIIARAIQEGSRVGYFAAIYRKVTTKVAEGIATGFFDDGPRMRRLGVTFANRYLAAVERHQRGVTAAKAWEIALSAASASRPLILQHLLLAINAHINLDLGIAAAQTALGTELPGLRRDFDRVNEILAALLSDVEHDIAEVSPWIGLLDRMGGRHDEEIMRFSIEVARTEAWRFASELAPLAGAHWPAPIGARDARVAHLARSILRPGVLSAGLMVIRVRESNDVPRVIQVLSRIPGPELEHVEDRVRRERAPLE
jgi:hypothetical protein